jgi:hypothetical protein
LRLVALEKDWKTIFPSLQVEIISFTCNFYNQTNNM